VNLEALLARICAGAYEFRVGGFSDFNQTKPASSKITQTWIIAEGWDFETVKFAGIEDGPALLGLNFQIIY
jgi:hypothetical protein